MRLNKLDRIGFKANVSGDSSIEYLSDGVTETLIGSLCELSDTRIIARSTVFRYKGRDVDPSAVARERAGDRAVAVGGKSLGGRIASMAVAAGMPADALVFLGYPLHPPGDVTKIRDAHLDAIRVPMLFLQGTRDPFARPDLLRAVIDRLGDRATLVEIPGGDHSFHRAGTPRDATAEGVALAPTVASFLLPLRRAA